MWIGEILKDNDTERFISSQLNNFCGQCSCSELCKIGILICSKGKKLQGNYATEYGNLWTSLEKLMYFYCLHFLFNLSIAIHLICANSNELWLISWCLHDCWKSSQVSAETAWFSSRQSFFAGTGEHSNILIAIESLTALFHSREWYSHNNYEYNYNRKGFVHAKLAFFEHKLKEKVWQREEIFSAQMWHINVYRTWPTYFVGGTVETTAMLLWQHCVAANIDLGTSTC